MSTQNTDENKEQDDEAAIKQIAALMDEEIKVRWHDRCPWGLRHIYHLIYGIVGTLIFLLIFVPFFLFPFALFAFIWYHCCCQCCGNKEKDYPKHDATCAKCCCYFTRALVGDCRVCLIETPPNKRGCCWYIRSKIAIVTGGLEYLFAAAGGPFEFVQHGLRLRNRYGDIYPQNHGLAVADYDLAVKFLHAQLHPRSHTFQTVPLNKTFMAVGRDAPIFHATGSPKHTQAREIVKAFLSDFTEIHKQRNTKALIETMQNNLWEIIGSDSKKKNFVNVTKDEIRTMVGSALFMLFLGTDFRLQQDEIDAILGLFGILPAMLTMPNWVNFLFGGYVFERRFLAKFHKVRKAFIRGKDTKQMIQFVHYCNGKNINISDAMNAITIIFIVAAFIGCDTPIWFGIEKFRSNPEMYVEQYIQNKVAFVKESVRIIGMKPGTTSYVLPQDMKLSIAGKPRNIPKGTTMLIMTGQCNRDPKIFGGDHQSFGYADSFDAERENLDKIISWNSVEEFIMLKDEQTAPRQCPGHDVALFIITMIVDMFLPDKLSIKLHEEKQAEEDKDDIKNLHGSLDAYPKLMVDLLLGLLENKNKNPKKAGDIKIPPVDFINDEDFDVEDGFEDWVDEAGNKVTNVELMMPRGSNNFSSNVTKLFQEWFNSFSENQLVYPVKDNDELWPQPSKKYANSWIDKELNPDLNMPKRNTIWKDINSDSAMSLLAFNSMWCHLTKKFDENIHHLKSIKKEKLDPIRDKIVYVCEATRLGTYSVRNGLLPYGACAYFDSEYKILGIYINTQSELIQPDDSIEWQQAKYIWKSSAIVEVTVIDHLVWVHLCTSNSLVYNTYKYLGSNNPIRRLMSIFTFGSSEININAKRLLINRGGLANRVFGFKYYNNQNGLQKGVADAYGGYKYSNFLNKYDSSMKDMNDNIFPIVKDMNEYYNITYTFVKAYVNLYYGQDVESINDKQLNDFYVNLRKDLKISSDSSDGNDDEKKEESFKENNMNSVIELLTNIICECTAWHEHVGQAFDYFSIDPKWIDTKLYPHRLEQSKNDFALLSILVIFTGFRYPKLKNNWHRVLLNDEKNEKAKKILDNWQNDLVILENKIDERNKNRRMPLMSCNPKVLECSVSI